MALSSDQLHVLGTSDALGEGRDLQVLPDGSIWLLNSIEPYFVGIRPDGTIVGAHGAKGGGPTEFRAPAGLVDGGLNGEAWTFDYIRHAFIRVSRPDLPWAQVDVPRDAIPPGAIRGGMSLMSETVRTARLGEELIIPWSTGTLQDGLPAYHSSLMLAHFSALDPRSGSVREVVFLGDVLEDPSAGFVVTDGGFPLWYRLWATCGTRLRVHDRVRNQIRGFAATGEEVEPIPLPPVTLTEVSREEFARAVFPLRQAEVTGGAGARLSRQDSLEVINTLAQRLTGAPHELAAYLPRYVDFRCSSDEVMWLQPIDLDAGGLQGGRTWLRLSSNGRAGQVTFPPRFDPLRFSADRVWGIQRSELDVGSVAWIDLPDGLAGAEHPDAPDE